jgi:hypothetical protein
LEGRSHGTSFSFWSHEDTGTEGEMLEVFHISSARPVAKEER